MLSEERYDKILAFLERQKTASAAELAALLDVSLSTVQRDLAAMDKAGIIKKVHGGAVLPSRSFVSLKPSLSFTNPKKEWEAGLSYMAALIQSRDSVYIGGGFLLSCMASQIRRQEARYVTNSLTVCRLLAGEGLSVTLLGGEYHRLEENPPCQEPDFVTWDIQALEQIKQLHFSKCFLSADSITPEGGYCISSPQLAFLNRLILSRTVSPYVAAQPDSFGPNAFVQFGQLEEATLLSLASPPNPEAYKEHTALKILPAAKDTK